MHIIQYDKLSTLDLASFNQEEEIEVRFKETEPDSLMAILQIVDIGNQRFILRKELYSSVKEFSTVAMKELLTLYAKNTIIRSDTDYYKRDDPKLHAYLSKLSYPGIESICSNLKEFSSQFKEGTITLNIPRFNKRNKRVKQNA